MGEITDPIKNQHAVHSCQEKQSKETLAWEGRKYSLHCSSHSCWYAQDPSPIHPLDVSIPIISILKITLLPQRWRQQVPPNL